MGSTAHLIVGGAHDGLLDWAVAEVERLEQCWSRFRPDSELAGLTAAAGTWRPVSRDLFEALTRARRLWEWTAGAFDPTIAAGLAALGYDRTFTAVDRDGGQAPSLAPAPGFDTVEVDEVARAVRIPVGVGLDLGGLGKGLAADLVAEGLVLRGAASALVSLGGDIRSAGEPPAAGWPVPVEDPFDERATWREVTLHADAVVTSTTLIRRWRRGDQELHHIIDPITGGPAGTGIAAVVAHGAEAWWAEGLAKAIMILGEDAAPTLLEGSGVEATLFRTDRSTRSIAPQEVACSPT